MPKKYRIALAAAAVLAMAGGYFFLSREKPEPESAGAAQEARELIYVYKNEKESLSGVTVRPASGTPVNLYQKNGEWIADISFPEEDLVASTVRSAGATALQMIADRVIEENPADLSVYGLDAPSIEVDFTHHDGKVSTLLVGNRNPGGNKYYVKMASGNTVYTVLAFSPKNFDFSMEDLRNRQIQFAFNPEAALYFRIVNNGETIRIQPSQEPDPDLIGQKTSSYKLMTPFTPKSVSADKMDTLIKAVPKVITIAEFIDDAPTDYSLYGLDPPRKVFRAKDPRASMTLAIGSQTPRGNYYARVDDDPKVIALSPLVVDPLFQFSAFDFIDKFILLINIKSVDRVSLMVNGRSHELEITRFYDGNSGMKNQDGTEDEGETHYFIDGMEIEEKPFKTLYQTLIGPLADSPNPETTVLSSPEVTITYTLNEGPVANPVVEFVKINRNFYAAFVNGKNEFIVSAYQIDTIKEALSSALAAAR